MHNFGIQNSLKPAVVVRNFFPDYGSVMQWNLQSLHSPRSGVQFAEGTSIFPVFFSLFPFLFVHVLILGMQPFAFCFLFLRNHMGLLMI